MRNIKLDIAKGFGICCVAITHCMTIVYPLSFWNNYLYNFIYTFHMPLFFVIAGYLMYQSLKGDRVKWIKKKACQLLIPHFIINIVLYFMSQTNIAEFGNLAKSYTFSHYLIVSTFSDIGDWFLWSLFIVCCLVLIVDWLQKYDNKKFIVSTVLLTIGIVCLPFRDGDYLRIARIQYYFPIFLAGYLIAKYKPQIKLKYMLWSIPISLGLFILVMKASNGSGGWGSIPSVDFIVNPISNLLRYAQVITIAPTVCLIVIGLSRTKLVANALVGMGKLTIGIYAVDLMIAGLFIGTGALGILTGSVIALTIGIIVTKLITINKYSGIILGDTRLLRNGT